MNMFGSEVLVTTRSAKPAAVSYGWGSGFDDAMVSEFVDACLEDREPLVTGYDGLQAARVAMAGYRSVAEGQPVEVTV
jgi:predicted dehydrogenase